MAHDRFLSPGIRWSRRTLICGAAATAAIASVRCVAAESALRTSRFAAVEAAFAAWADAGGSMIIDRSAMIASPITVTLKPGVAYSLVSEGAHTLTYTGPRFHWAICLYSRGGNQLAVSGPLTIDAANRVSLPFFFRFEDVAGPARRDCTVDGLRTRNARMQAGISPVDGSRTNSYGATGIALSGGFDRLIVRNVAVENVSRAAGAGLTGSQGCAGIAVTGDGLTNPKHVLIENFAVSNIDSEDPVRSAARGDMDGVLVFQGPESSGTRPVVRRGTITNAAGRAIKMFAPGGGGVTEDLTIYRSRPGGPNGSVDIAHQHGDGTIRDIRITYASDAHANGTTTIGFSSGTRRDPRFQFGEAIVENIVIEDRTGQPKEALFGLQYNVAGDRQGRRYSITRVTDTGRSRYLFLPGGLGTHQQAIVLLANLDIDLATAVLASEDPTQLLQVLLENARLVRGGRRLVPFKVSYRDVPVPAKLEIRPVKRGQVTGID